jgi:hypothetical protein
MDVFALSERLFEVLFQMVGPLEPIDLIAASPSNGLVNDSYHGVMTLHACDRLGLREARLVTDP